MLVPRNIIYDMRFVPDWLHASADADRKFRDGLAALTGGSSKIIPLGRARTGIYLLVKSAAREGRRKIILSPYTIPDVINLVKFGGGVPVFVDFLPNSTNVDIDHLAELIDSDTAGVMVTHYHVSQKDMAAIGDLCRQRGVALFDDCAISIGASYNGCPIGSLTDGSVFSFSGFKVLNYYWGGALAVPPGKTADALEQEVLSWPRLSTRLYLPQIRKVALYAAVTGPALFPLVFRLRRRVIGPGKIVDIFPLSRVETVQLDDTIRSRPANVALCEWVRKLETVRSVIDHRRGIAAIYDRYFREINVSAETPESIRQESAFVNYPIVVGEERRDTIYRAALSANFDVGLSLYPNAHEMPSLSGTEGRTNRISKLVRSIVTLPTHTRATPEYSERLAKFMSGLLTAGQGRG